MQGPPTFAADEMTRRVDAFRRRMRERGVDAALVYGAGRSMDVQYLTNWPGTREAFAIVRENDLVLLVQFANHVPNAERVARAEVRWAGPGNDAAVALLQGAHRLGVVGALPWSMARRVGAELVDMTADLRALRAVASDAELPLIREAARVTDAAMVALEGVRPGMRETDLVHVVESAITAAGGTPGIHFVATTPMRAPNIGVPSQIQSSRVIAPGDVLITEISGHMWGYGGQIHRAYAIGEAPTAEYARLHDVAAETYERVCAALRDGATVADVLDAADVVHERGLTLYDDLLHGIDQLPPVLQTRRTRRAPFDEAFVFRENMVVVVQPNVVSDARGASGLQVGETVRVTRSGVERLHSYPMRFVRCG